MRQTPNGILTTQEILLFCSLSRDGEQGFEDKLVEEEDQKKFTRRMQELKGKGWEVGYVNSFADSKHGYYGVCCYKINSGILHIVFSHRGTCFDKLGNILADICIAQERLPEILEESSDFIQQCLGKLTSKFKYDKLLVSHTGFSLGGFIAGASAADNLTKGYDSEAITVDSPGIRSHILAMGYNEEKTIAPKVFNYVCSPDMVNTCNKHTGKVLLMAWLPEEKTVFTTSFKITIEQLDYTKESNKSILEELKKELEYTLRLHYFPTIIDGFESKAQGTFPFKEVYKWPVATIRFLEADRSTMSAFHLLSIPFGIAFVADGQNMYAGGLLALNTALRALWEFTKYNNRLGVEMGTVGLHDYYRRNKVYYTQDEYVHDMKWMSGLTLLSSVALMGGVKTRQPVVSLIGAIGFIVTGIIYGREGTEAIQSVVGNFRATRVTTPSITTTATQRLSSPVRSPSGSSSSSSSSNSDNNGFSPPSY